MNADPRLDALLTAYLAGDLPAEELAELEARLERDPAARERFAFLCRQDLALHDVLSAPASAVLPTRRFRSRRFGRWTSASSTAPRAAVAAVLAAALTGLLVYAATRRTEAPPRPIAVQPSPPLTKEPADFVRPSERLPEPELTKEPGSFVRPPAPAPPEPVLTKDPGSSVRPPAPAPEPPPAPASRPPDPPTTVAAPAAVARLETIEGEVRVLREGRSLPPREADAFLPDDGLAVRGGKAALVFPDGTRIALAAESRIEGVSDGPEGKRMRMVAGRLEAVVAKQPAGRAMAIHTAAADVRVLGTTLAVAVTEESTRLEVTEGKVRITRRADGRGVDVPAGHFAVAGPAGDLLLRPLRMVDVIRVSFGPAQAPLPDGFVADTGAAFDAASGMGWNGDRRQAARLRPGPKSLLERRLIVAGEARQVARWDVALQNGRYYVTLSCGDAQNPQGPHHVSVEGRLLVRETMTAAGEFLVVEDHPVDVRDGRLTLVLGGHGSAKVDLDNTGDTALNYVIVRRAE